MAKGQYGGIHEKKMYSAENILNDKELEELKQKLKTELDKIDR